MNPATKILRFLNRLTSERSAEVLISDLEKKVGIGVSGGAARSGETAVLELLESFTQGEITIFDVGANQGQYTSEVLSHLKDRENFMVHAFEPSPRTYKMYMAAHGSDPRILANNFGLAESASQATLFMNSEGSGLASLTKRNLDHFGVDHGKVEEVVRLETLDSYVASRDIGRIDLLKIDVEGHELDVLKGAKTSLVEGRINLVQFEFGGCNIDTRTFFRDFFFFFKEVDFELFRILRNGKLLAITNYREKDEKFRSCNYLAVAAASGLKEKFSQRVIR